MEVVRDGAAVIVDIMPARLEPMKYTLAALRWRWQQFLLVAVPSTKTPIRPTDAPRNPDR